MRADIDIDEAVHLEGFGRKAFFLADGVAEQLDVHIVADVGQVAVLLAAEDISGAAEFEVAHGNLEAGAELGELLDGGEAFLGDFAQGLAALVGEVGEGPARGAADSAADLVELREAEMVGVLDDERVDVRDVDAGFDDSGADEDVDFVVDDFLPDARELLFGHFSVRVGNLCFGNLQLYRGGFL